MKKTIRLDKMLGNLGFGSRSEVKQWVRQGSVTVNGVAAKDPGMQIRPEEDAVALDGEPVVYRETVYVMMNKPAGLVSATEDRRDRTVVDLLPDELRARAPFPVGRLDKDTEGLLLLTNDGKLAHDLLSPRKHVPKTYRALIEGETGERDAEAFAAGVTLDDGYVTLPARLRVLAAAPPGAEPGDREMAEAMERVRRTPELRRAELELAERRRSALSWIELTIQEGKFHQVKRMFEAVGQRVLYLRRSAIGPLSLDPALEPGQWRELTEAEMERLREYRKGF
ncbi:pseudouridine synthase [Cohnella algarum]|uniref:pseudouridine synthase n=1 Tax=Cohnella algarum TaxID=2044859 RepID=UPI00196788CC|nr:pseudouridine synthase [Cohnella algarum]MBN2984767.1 rRNA pseudouridine synthase [Cohnella algarum]